MKSILLSFIAAVLVSVPALAESVATGKYHTKEPIEKAYLAALHAAASRFDITLADQSQGIIRAHKKSWSHEVYGKLFVTVSKDDDGATIVAIFRRTAITKRGPLTKWAIDFGDQLKKEIPDLTLAVE